MPVGPIAMRVEGVELGAVSSRMTPVAARAPPMASAQLDATIFDMEASSEGIPFGVQLPGAQYAIVLPVSCAATTRRVMPKPTAAAPVPIPI